LCIAAGAGAIEHEDVPAFLGHGAAEMAFDEEGCEIGGAAAASAGDAVPVGDEEAVGDEIVVGKFGEEILVVIPADAAAAFFHKAETGENETAGAEAD
jgi:hypothetical protein